MLSLGSIFFKLILQAFDLNFFLQCCASFEFQNVVLGRITSKGFELRLLNCMFETFLLHKNPSADWLKNGMGVNCVLTWKKSCTCNSSTKSCHLQNFLTDVFAVGPDNL